MGFEPMRAEHNGLAVHRLNLSATLSFLLLEFSYLCFEHTLVALKLWTDYDAQVVSLNFVSLSDRYTVKLLIYF